MATDLEMAFKALDKKKGLYNKLWAYYDGNQPLVYSTERLRKVFSELNARFTQNWCAVVVDSVLERLNVRQLLVVGDETMTKELNAWWQKTLLHLDSDDAHLCALVTGEAAIIAWPDENEILEAYYNDSRLVHVFYDEERPHRVRFAAKWWETGEERVRLTLYYADRLEYYISNVKSKDLKEAKSFEPLVIEGTETLEGMPNAVVNPYGEVSVFHLRRERRAIKSELGPSILDNQDAVNKLMADMMVAAEFGAFKQRYVISQADVGTLKNAPDEIWDLPAGDGLGQGTQVGELSSSELGNYMKQIQDLSTAMGKMARLPQSYFFLGARADPSGESLIAMEGPLIKKVEAYIERFQETWISLAMFWAKVNGKALEREQIRAVYDAPQTIQPFTQAQVRETNLRATIPLKTQLRREGWTPQELAEMDADAAEVAAKQSANLALALIKAQREFDQGGSAGSANGQEATRDGGAPRGVTNG